jgi:hypothetical protein
MSEFKIYEKYRNNQEVAIENFQVHKEYKCHNIHVKLDQETIDHFLTPLPKLDLPNLEPQPFLLVRSTGVQWLAEIKDMIYNRLNMVVTDEKPLDDFETCARYIYTTSPEDPNSFLWFAASRKFLGEQKAKLGHVFFLDKSYLNNYQQIIDNKRAMRKELGITPFRMFYNGRIMDTDTHHIHCPDPNELAYQHNLVQYFLNK